ncbi:ADD domain-containing protein 1 [Anticarsia gemmatalis]|uniref:ADD domain-containing protein 1 n=1 Tax=Anticarsia gemmatalis TaxID=129554 RepID=UPI003F772F03
MSEIANSEGTSETEKPVSNDVIFPPFPDPTDEDFDEDVSEEEKLYFKEKFSDLNTVKNYRLHCTACDRHMGCSARNDRMRAHPMLRTLVCHSCHTFYNSGEFEKGDDGSELYCRWCGQGGQVYCCSDCPHVFCAKCIRRNLGTPKIKEIETADDWKCFKCNPSCLKDLRAICWAVLRYCDLKNKITHQTEDLQLKAIYQKDCALDHSECCKHKISKRNQKINESLIKKKEIKKEADTKTAAAIISKMPSTIQVKKFASVVIDESNKSDKKAQKRSASPKHKSILVKNPISIAPCAKVINSVGVPPLAKKVRLPNCSTISTPMRYTNVPERKTLTTYARIRPKLAQQLTVPISTNFNGFSANLYRCATPINDNINLSIESLTQGLDMSAVSALATAPDDDVVCTPDFPLEPLCEVNEDNDDDVQCITPAPVAVPKFTNPPPLVPRASSNLTEVTPENIIQMTDNDVTVNESTGGLKFRVDPQTLSSNKMYRLPDGRIFAINANPNMPGGYSATIVAVTEASKGIPKGATFAAKLSSVSTSTSTPKSNRHQMTRFIKSKHGTSKVRKTSRSTDTSTRECDMKVPVEWYRYNLIDAVDAMEYSLQRLNKLKKEATTVYLRTRSVNEMRSLHRSLERLLNTASTRFTEIRVNLNKELKQYVVTKKAGGNTSEEDDDVEILPDVEEDPIFIDENSTESHINGSENQEVDLTGPGSSEYNDSGENRNDILSKGDMSTLTIPDIDNDNSVHVNILNFRDNNTSLTENKKDSNDNDENDVDMLETTNQDTDTLAVINLKCHESINSINGGENEKLNTSVSTKSQNEETTNTTSNEKVIKSEVIKDSQQNTDKSDEKIESNTPKTGAELNKNNIKTEPNNDKNRDLEGKRREGNEQVQDSNKNRQACSDKTQDSEMSEEMIETLLKDDNTEDNATANTDTPKALQVI